MVINCNFCGNKIDSEDSYCMHCGKPVIENRCESCDISLPDCAQFCPQCGSESTFKSNGLFATPPVDTPAE